METLVTTNENNPHVVFIPFPAQSHIKCMLKLAKLLHHKGVHITFVNTEFTHNRFINSGGPHCLDGAPGFKFETIPDGLTTDPDQTTQELNEIREALLTNCLGPFVELVASHETSVTCIISDGFMPFATYAAEKLGVPIMQFWTVAACAFMGFYIAPDLLEKKLIPLQDETCLTNGYLNTSIDWIPGLEGFNLKDLPSYTRATDVNNTSLKYCVESAKTARKISHIIIHTFDALESNVIKAIEPMFPNVYTVGPLQLLLNQIENEEETKKLDFNGYSLWKEESECIKWLNSKEPNSVVYVNFGSITMMSLEQLMELGWGLANSNQYFLWIIRPDMVIGESAILPKEFEDIIKKRGFIAGWCSQEEVLNHPSVGGFLTHCGWGSIIESLAAGVPMICCPFYGDQPTNCRQMCKEWEAGMEIGNEVKRNEVERVVAELMVGDKGSQMRNKVKEWKKRMEIATSPDGSSSLSVEKLANEISMLSRK
ncbi:UDP-glycosyltransferase 85C2-like [Rutidosis leptorrhynchoides]|uniref:UDP-glycosyltransferase 85C2-like n=1 Tax=Rutidosis leptorrhynchoides TaxID=125765 RepID=UPI003A999049